MKKGLEMLGLKKDMEAAMEGAKKAGEKTSLSNLKKMYGKYVSKANAEEGDEEEMEKTSYKKSLSTVVRNAFRK